MRRPNGRLAIPGGRHLWLAVLGLLAALGLAACGGDGGIESGGDEDAEPAEVPVATAEGQAEGSLYVANWPFYIDRKTVPEFEDETGIKVKYVEEVNDNADFFGKVQPLLERGGSGDRDVFVVTDWMAKKMFDLGYLQKFDKPAVDQAFANLKPSLESPSFDPDREYSIPWQSGLTGLVVDTAKAPEIDEVADLFDPKYKGKVTVLKELRDTVPLLLQSEGIPLEEATTQDWLDQIDRLEEAADSGQIRRFTGNGYTRDLANGDIVAAMGWSGDAVQLQADNPDIQFIKPTDGCNLWSDNIVIPIGAPNPTAAYEFINYVYEPENQAQIADYNYYVTPVAGTKDVLAEQGSEAAESELVFPTEEFTDGCETQDSPPADGEAEIERAFQAVVTG